MRVLGVHHRPTIEFSLYFSYLLLTLILTEQNLNGGVLLRSFPYLHYIIIPALTYSFIALISFLLLFYFGLSLLLLRSLDCALIHPYCAAQPYAAH